MGGVQGASCGARSVSCRLSGKRAVEGRRLAQRSPRLEISSKPPGKGGVGGRNPPSAFVWRARLARPSNLRPCASRARPRSMCETARRMDAAYGQVLCGCASPWAYAHKFYDYLCVREPSSHGASGEAPLAERLQHHTVRSLRRALEALLAIVRICATAARDVSSRRSGVSSTDALRWAKRRRPRWLRAASCGSCLLAPGVVPDRCRDHPGRVISRGPVGYRVAAPPPRSQPLPGNTIDAVTCRTA